MTHTTTAGASAPAVPATLIGWFEPGTTEWHAARATGIGGSEIAAVLGISPYDSPFSLWHRKRGQIGQAVETDVMYWGKKHEPTICDEFANRHPHLTITPSPTYAATGRPWHVVNPDRLAITADNTVELLEAKTSRDASDWGEEGTDEIPVHYRAQCMWYLDALQAHTCHVVVLIGGSDYREYRIEYNPVEAATMRDHAAAFVESLRTGTRPAIDGHDATFRAIKETVEGLDDIDIEISPALRDRYFTALDAAKAADTEKRLTSGLVLDEINTGRRAICALQTVATRTVRNGRTYALQPARNRGNVA